VQLEHDVAYFRAPAKLSFIMNQAEDESLTKSIGKTQIERTETKICDEGG
jgi:hypothetical protein